MAKCNTAWIVLPSWLFIAQYDKMTTGFTLEGNKWQQECQTDELVALKFKQLRIILINI